MGRRAASLVLTLVAGGAGGLAGCSKKLSSGNGMDVLFYDVLGSDRGTTYYYNIVKTSHDKATFAYKNTGDTYVADKCVDAIQHLGTAEYTRLEGEIQVVLLLSDVLIEDPVPLARDQAAGSLALLAGRMPVAPYTAIPERGDRFLSRLRDELDALHDPEHRRRRVDTPATKQRIATLVEEIGAYEMPNLQLTKDALRWFPTRPYITEETDVGLREVFDRAMVRRARAVVFASLEGAVLDPAAHVRRAAVIGLRTLGYAKAVDGIAERLDVETNPLVRAEMAEYFGAVGGKTAATRLVTMLADDDGGVRYKAHLALVRLAGQDLGKVASAWDAWLARGGGTSAPTPFAPAAPAPTRAVPAAPIAPPPAAVTAPPPSVAAPPVLVAPPAAPPPVPAAPPMPPAPPPVVLPPVVVPPVVGPPGALPPPTRRSR